MTVRSLSSAAEPAPAAAAIWPLRWFPDGSGGSVRCVATNGRWNGRRQWASNPDSSGAHLLQLRRKKGHPPPHHRRVLGALRCSGRPRITLRKAGRGCSDRRGCNAGGSRRRSRQPTTHAVDRRRLLPAGPAGRRRLDRHDPGPESSNGLRLQRTLALAWPSNNSKNTKASPVPKPTPKYSAGQTDLLPLSSLLSLFLLLSSLLSPLSSLSSSD